MEQPIQKRVETPVIQSNNSQDASIHKEPTRQTNAFNKKEKVKLIDAYMNEIKSKYSKQQHIESSMYNI